MNHIYRKVCALTLCALCLSSTASATLDLDNTVFHSDPAITQVQSPPTYQWGSSLGLTKTAFCWKTKL